MRGRGRRQDEQSLSHRHNLYIGELPWSTLRRHEGTKRRRNTKKNGSKCHLRVSSFLRAFVSNFCFLAYSSPTSFDLKTSANPRNASTIPASAHITAGIML